MPETMFGTKAVLGLKTISMPKLALCSVAMLIITSIAEADDSGSGDDPNSVVRVEVTPSVAGLAKPARQIEMSLLIDGTIEAILVREGDWSAEGDQLVQLDDAEQAARVALAETSVKAEAELEQARLALREAKTQYQRMAQAFRQQAATEWELQETEVKRDRARNLVALAEERQQIELRNLELEMTKLEAYRIAAPFAGQIIEIDKDAGQAVTRTETLLTLADLKQLEAVLYIPADYLGRLQVGESYRLQLGSPVDKEVQAQLTFVNHVMDSGSRTFRCTFLIDNRALDLPAGIEVHLDLTSLATG